MFSSTVAATPSPLSFFWKEKPYWKTVPPVTSGSLGLPLRSPGCALGLPSAPTPRSLACAPWTPLSVLHMPGSLRLPPGWWGLCAPWTPPRSMPGSSLCAPGLLHAREPRALSSSVTPVRAPRPGASPLWLTAGPRRDALFPVCSPLPCRAGIMGVCLSTDVTLGATGILGLRKLCTQCLAPGSSLAPMRWVAPAPFMAQTCLSPRPAYSQVQFTLGFRRPCLSFQIVLFEKEKREAQAPSAQTSAGGQGRVPTAFCTA